ncbi:DUF1707 domain-containing protein [Rhodococcus sp. IEGM 1351]|uniref:DUF1707 SHOCT-like domain-containing protein n=1 Tax=Rhodococcus sp. IEGM 1351 TaxID=3047089 RepID=UPI0024B7ECAB|nr:DUF1707 domain-containing protein [Rhodococcus sp. IEGM 1351]MDI9938914.1 DUF1707 domain-containing protein [Rhodococcus sp. IEGM 1351]
MPAAHRSAWKVPVATERWMRASDADRARVVHTLEHEVGTGRLTLDEYSDRVAAAYGARTLGELTVLTRDLPTLNPRPVAARNRNGRNLTALAPVAGLLIAFAGSPPAAAMAAMMPGMGCG